MATKGQNGYPMASYSWKEITLKIAGTAEEIVLPVMASSRVWSVKCVLSEMTGVLPGQIEFLLKNRKHKNTDECASTVTVKGIRSFTKQKQEYPHPHAVIGLGHLGLRQCMHYHRNKQDYFGFERQWRTGGNAWVAIANPTSKLQSECVQYQLQYDPYEGGAEALLTCEQYSGQAHNHWPSTARILAHFDKVCDDYGITPNLRCLVEVEDIQIDEAPGKHMMWKKYILQQRDLKDKQTSEINHGNFASICHMPGVLVYPHRINWPGEDVFEGQIAYGFTSDMDYKRVAGQRGVVIGFGAFAHENLRTFCEYDGEKVYIVCRHLNLMLPRVVCWWMNQSIFPPGGALALDNMTHMYKLVGQDPWTFYSVLGNKERTVASIKQSTRWGISDVLFLAMVYDKLEVLNSEVKRFKKRSVLLINGTEIEDINHVMKCCGFDADFSCDRIHHTKEMIGQWPDGDWRRWIWSDTSAIDASRFSGVNLSPPAVAMTFQTLWYIQHPADGPKALASDMLCHRRAEPEKGKPAYHWTPRENVINGSVLAAVAPEIIAYLGENDNFKKASYTAVCDIDEFVTSCKLDWDHYGKMFAKSRPNVKHPEYPYTKEIVERMVRQEQELIDMENEKMQKRVGGAGAGGMTEEQLEAYTGPALIPALEAANRGMEMEPARAVLRKYGVVHTAPAVICVREERSVSPEKGSLTRKKDIQDWLREGQRKKQQLLNISARGSLKVERGVW